MDLKPIAASICRHKLLYITPLERTCKKVRSFRYALGPLELGPDDTVFTSKRERKARGSRCAVPVSGRFRVASYARCGKQPPLFGLTDGGERVNE
jgi:hypothetical protein